MATITGRVISSETVSTAVSGLASFGYVMQAIDDACTTTTVPTTTLINPATNPNALLIFYHDGKTWWRLCFIAIDNVGNARAVASQILIERMIVNVKGILGRFLLMFASNTGWRAHNWRLGKLLLPTPVMCYFLV